MFSLPSSFPSKNENSDSKKKTEKTNESQSTNPLDSGMDELDLILSDTNAPQQNSDEITNEKADKKANEITNDAVPKSKSKGSHKESNDEDSSNLQDLLSSILDVEEQASQSHNVNTINTKKSTDNLISSLFSFPSTTISTDTTNTTIDIPSDTKTNTTSGGLSDFGGFSLPSFIAPTEIQPKKDEKTTEDTTQKDRQTIEGKTNMEGTLHESVEYLLHSVQQQRDPLKDFDMMSETDQRRYQLYLRTKLVDADRMLSHLSSLPMAPRINPSVAHVLSLILKEMAGDIILLGLQVRKERQALYKSMQQELSNQEIPNNDLASLLNEEQPTGPLNSDEIREAYRRWREREAKIGRDKWKDMKKRAWRR